MHTFTNPILSQDITGRYFVTFYINNKRCRLYNGKRLGLDIYPNKASLSSRRSLAEDLMFHIHKRLKEGWLNIDESRNISLFAAVSRFQVNPNFTDDYIKAVQGTKTRFLNYCIQNGIDKKPLIQISVSDCIPFLNESTYTPSTFNHERKRLASILSIVLQPFQIPNPVVLIKKQKEKPTLHKPFRDVNSLLEDIKSFNENLFLCCLLTYGCLLRPHQEIRNLKWGDFSEDMKHISLSGKRNKSGRNRIVPLNPYILQYLKKGLDTDNIFTGKEKPYNKDYFKTLWSRYKAQSNVLEDLQTLYSFRHSGAIEIYKRTGSVTILQSAMGHASLAVTLGYLRGLEIPSLKLEDMPRL
jgi:integrase